MTAGTNGELEKLLRRYGGATAESLAAVLCPLLVPIASLDRAIQKLAGESHYRATFTAKVTNECRGVLRRGCTGKFVSGDYVGGTGAWAELAKGRIIEVDRATGIAAGEVYVGGSKSRLEEALKLLDERCFLEVDQYGAAAKVLSALSEYFLAESAKASGYSVSRMPEDMARHLGVYANYDFEFEKDGVVQRVEVKSLWGTNTDHARLIHSRTSRPRGDPKSWTEDQQKSYYPTSSCKFVTQDIFAVNLFLRTGDVRNFAFARSVPSTDSEYGLPCSRKYPEHVHQNPVCRIGDGKWFGTIDEVWGLR